MNSAQALAVLKKAVAYCPAMASQLKATTDEDGDSDIRRAWVEALGPVDFTDACAAVTALGSRPLQPGQTLWIQPGHVIAEVHRIRDERISAGAHRLTGAPTDPDAYLAWLRTSLRQLGDGTYQPPTIAPTGHTIAELPAPGRTIR